MAATLQISIVEADGRETPATLTVREVLLAGYTGRDRDAVMDHIRELEEIGVAPPPRVPMVYTVAPELVTTADAIEVNAAETSGEAEICLALYEQELLVGVGSDHTDRKAEAVDVARSKTLCAKVIGQRFWRVTDLRDHWDEIELRSWTWEGESRHLYQRGTLGEFLRVLELLREVRDGGHPDLSERLIFGGTLPTIGGLAYGTRFEAELRDPLLNRTLTCAYDVRTLGAR
jgi:hypothetical protein